MYIKSALKKRTRRIKRHWTMFSEHICSYIYIYLKFGWKLSGWIYNQNFSHLLWTPNQNYLKMVPRRWIVEEWWMAGSVEDRMDIWTMASFSRSDHLRRRGLLRKKWRTLPLRAIRCLSIAIDVGAEKCSKKVLCQKSFAALMEESSMLRNCAGTGLDIFAQFMKICEILYYITGFAEFDIL